MKFKIGSLEVETKPALGSSDYLKQRLRYPASLGREPRSIYYWDCALEPGGNPAKPKYHVVEPSLSLLVLKQNGAVDTARTDAVKARLLQASGAANLAALDNLLLTNFKPIMVPIPWINLSLAFGKRFKVRVFAWNGYRDMYLRPTSGPVQDIYILSYPSYVAFDAGTVGICEIEDALHILIGRHGKVVSVPAGAGPGKEFTTEHHRDLRARLKADPTGTRRLADKLKSAFDKQQTKYWEKFPSPEDF